MQLLLPQADVAHAALLRHELESCAGVMAELRAKHSWDAKGKAPNLLGDGDEEDESDDEEDEEVAPVVPVPVAAAVMPSSAAAAAQLRPAGRATPAVQPLVCGSKISPEARALPLS